MMKGRRGKRKANGSKKMLDEKRAHFVLFIWE
jgi:hypothetical protein